MFTKPSTSLSFITNIKQPVSNGQYISLLHLGAEASTTSTSYNNLYTLFVWNRDYNLDNKSIYFEGVFRIDSGGIGYMDLYNETDAVAVVELTTTITSGTSLSQRVRSDAIVLNHDKVYSVRVKTNNSTYLVRYRGARLILL